MGWVVLGFDLQTWLMGGFLRTLLWVWFVFEKCWDFTEISNGLGCWETRDAMRLVFLQYYWCGLINGRFFGSIDSWVWFVNVVDGRFSGSIALGLFLESVGFWLGEWNPDKITLRDLIHSFFQIIPFCKWIQHRSANWGFWSSHVGF